MPDNLIVLEFEQVLCYQLRGCTTSLNTHMLEDVCTCARSIIIIDDLEIGDKLMSRIRKTDRMSITFK